MCVCVWAGFRSAPILEILPLPIPPQYRDFFSKYGEVKVVTVALNNRKLLKKVSHDDFDFSSED